jgi:hypothetical protein
MSTSRIVKSAAIVVLAVVGAISAIASEPPRSAVYLGAYKTGRSDAVRDIKRGILAIEEWGLPADFAVSHAYRRILKQRYGITARRVAGCEVDDTILGHGNGYNEVSEAEIARRYGPHLLDRVYARAEKQQPISTR